MTFVAYRFRPVPWWAIIVIVGDFAAWTVLGFGPLHIWWGWLVLWFGGNIATVWGVFGSHRQLWGSGQRTPDGGVRWDGPTPITGTLIETLGGFRVVWPILRYGFPAAAVVQWILWGILRQPITANALTINAIWLLWTWFAWLTPPVDEVWMIHTDQGRQKLYVTETDRLQAE